MGLSLRGRFGTHVALLAALTAAAGLLAVGSVVWSLYLLAPALLVALLGLEVADQTRPPTHHDHAHDHDDDGGRSGDEDRGCGEDETEASYR